MGNFVPLKVNGLPKGGWTEVTLIRLFPSVGDHVTCQIVFDTERCLANNTYIGFLPSMDAAVPIEAALLNEGSITHGAYIGLELGVDSLMSTQVRDLLEGLFAHVTLVRLLSCVRSLVDVEMAALYKACPTLIATIWLLPAVQTHMQTVTVDVGELGIAVGAGQCLLVGMLAVLHQFVHARKYHMALITFIFLSLVI